MAKHTPKYILIAALTLLSAGFTHWSTGRTPTVSFSARLDQLPLTIGVWKGVDLPLTQDVKHALNADRILSRRYVSSETGQPVELLIVYRKYGRRDFAHRPELCYPAAGWEIIEKTYTTLPYNGNNVQARLVIAEKGITRDAIAYWFASGERTEANYVKQQLWMAMDRLQTHKYGWAFIRVNTPVFDNDDAAVTDMRSFLKEADRPLVQILTGSSERR
jgi:EpsI family protein